jgi:hypothetical protein
MIREHVFELNINCDIFYAKEKYAITPPCRPVCYDLEAVLVSVLQDRLRGVSAKYTNLRIYYDTIKYETFIFAYANRNQSMYLG